MLMLRRQDRGVMLILAMLLMAILWFAVLSFSSASLHSLRMSSAYLGSERASAAADAGMTYTLHQLRKDPEYRPPASARELTRTTDTFRVEMFDFRKAPTPIPTDSFFVRSTGMSRDGRTKQVTAVIRFGTESVSLLDYAIFSNDLDISGGSNVRVYDSTGTAGDLTGKADLATNATKKGTIRLDSGVSVDGVVWVGPGGETKDTPKNPWSPTWGTDNVVWKNWNASTKGETPLNKEVEYPPLVVPEAGDEKIKVDWRGSDIKPGSYRELQVDGGGVARLSGGTYVFDMIKLGGGAKLNVVGDEPVYVYVKKRLDLNNGSFSNASKNARNLVFLVEDKAKVEIAGGTAAYAVIYGPGADVKISGGNTVYGAIVADKVNIEGGSQFYYDLGLKIKPPTIPGVGSGGGSGGSGGGLEVLGRQRI
jgi:hypothetical protein